MAGVRSKPLSSGKYRGFFVDMNAKQKLFTGTASKAETLRMARRLEDEHRQIRLGYRPAPVSADKHKARPFAEVKAEYMAWGKSQGRKDGKPWSKLHARTKETKLDWWQEQLGLETLADFDGLLPRAEEALRELEAKERTGKTLANYAEALRGFCSWAKLRGYLAADPLDGMGGFDTDPRTKRRAMEPDELTEFLEHCLEHRRLLYEVAFASGLRANELRSLDVEDLDAVGCGLRLRADWTKNKHDGFQPLPRSLVERLQAFGESGEAARLYQKFFSAAKRKPKDIPAHPLLYVSTHPARGVDADLRRADIPKWTPKGKLDFHAARTTYVSYVMESGASVKEAQVLARHSTPQLTLNVYGRARDERLFKAVEAVGQMLDTGPESEAIKAHSRHLQAAGAEGVDVNTANEKACEVAAGGEAQGSSPFRR